MGKEEQFFPPRVRRGALPRAGVNAILDIVHYKQLVSYLKLTDKKVGLLINFNVDDLMDGIHRVVNNY